MVIPIGAWGWLYWGWTAEQTALDTLRPKLQPTGYILRVDPAYAPLQHSLGRYGYVLDRVRLLALSESTTPAESQLVATFRNVETLCLWAPHDADTGSAFKGWAVEVQ